MHTKPQRSVLCLFPEEKIKGLESFRQRYIMHPGKDVPFHITLISEFIPPDQLNDAAIAKLNDIARETSRFKFAAKPISSFPTSRTLYLTPSPLAPIEALATRLFKAFPAFYDQQYGLPVYHMTVALGNPLEQTNQIIEEYFRAFGEAPLQLRADRLGVCAQYGDEWHHCLSVKLGN